MELDKICAKVLFEDHRTPEEETFTISNHAPTSYCSEYGYCDVYRGEPLPEQTPEVYDFDYYLSVSYQMYDDVRMDMYCEYIARPRKRP